MDTIGKKLLESVFKTDLQMDDIISFVNKFLPVGSKRKFYYKPAGKIPPYISRAGERVLDRCRKNLGMPRLWIQWMERAFEPERGCIAREIPIYGQAMESNRLLIRWDIPLRDVMFTVAHEAHHLWFEKEHGKDYPLKSDREMWEGVADRFAAKILRELDDEDQERDNPSVCYPSWLARY